jgi:hypothetical protein
VTPKIRAPSLVRGRWFFCELRPPKQNEIPTASRDPFLVAEPARTHALLLFSPRAMKALESNACFNHNPRPSLGHGCGLAETRLARAALRSPCSAETKVRQALQALTECEDSSVEEPMTFNHLVAGSNPAPALRISRKR